ncbi:MAG: hypothetical protein WCD00_15670 [Desulfuromonadaceae bacterium]
MSPAPNRMHQKVSEALFNQIFNRLKGKTRESYSASPEMYGSRDMVAVPLLGDLEIDLAEVFAL